MASRIMRDDEADGRLPYRPTYNATRACLLGFIALATGGHFNFHLWGYRPNAAPHYALISPKMP